MYAAEIDQIHYTFEASGSLWQDALVMRDRQTGSLWSQISGTCISGPMEGTTLVQYPAHHTTFGEFKKQYPEGLLLKKGMKGRDGSHYDEYFADKTKLGIFGRIDSFTRLGAKEKIFGLRLESGEVAISKAFLIRNHHRIIDAGHRRILIYYNPTGQTVNAYYLPSSKSGSKEEIVVKENSISFGKENTVWSLSRGQVISGEGQSLSPLPVITAFWFAWVSFFPQTELIH